MRRPVQQPLKPGRLGRSCIQQLPGGRGILIPAGAGRWRCARYGALQPADVVEHGKFTDTWSSSWHTFDCVCGAEIQQGAVIKFLGKVDMEHIYGAGGGTVARNNPFVALGWDSFDGLARIVIPKTSRLDVATGRGRTVLLPSGGTRETYAISLASRI